MALLAFNQLLSRGYCRPYLVVAALIVGLGGCKEKRPVAETPTPIRVQQVSIETATHASAYTGTVHARYETDIGFRVAGKIVERRVNIGDRVEKDQVLLRLDPTDYRLAVESSEAELAAAKSSQAQAAADEQRYRTLVADRWVAPAAYDQKKAAADEASGRVERAERALSVARNQLDYTELHANEAGVITALKVEVGQVVAVGQIVGRLAQLTEREVVVAIPESRLDDVRASQATVELWADISRHYSAKLREFSPEADPITRTYQARFTIETADDWVALGMTATIRLIHKEGRSVVRVPLGAIYTDGNSASVWVLTSDNAHLRRTPIQVLEYHQDDVLISGGLGDGDRIVSLGAPLLDERKLVRIVEERVSK